MTTLAYSSGLSASVLHKMPSSSTMRLDDDETMSFDSSGEEAAYYRDRYRRVGDLLEETRAELDEFQASSKELEDELEKELAATEKQQAELKERIKRLEAEKEEWKTKHVSLQKMHSSTVSAMQREMDNLRSERDKTLVALRDLEMGNDELERNERVAVSSLLDLESKYNRAIEEKTLLEQEVVQKTELEEDAQRLKDELRDANDQIGILRDQLTRHFMPTPPSSVSVPLSPSRSATELPETDGADIGRLAYEPSAPPSKASPAPTLPPKTGSGLSVGSGMSRSSTLSNIPTISPSLRRATGQIPARTGEQSGLGGLSRSNTTRNLIGVSGIGMPSSPSIPRSKSGLPQPSPMRVTERKESRSKAAKILTDLRSRIKATDDRLGSKVTRRTVSNPLSENGGKETNSKASASSVGRPVNSRLAALAKDPLHTPVSAGNTSSILSPNGWILVDDPEETPPGQMIAPVAGGRYEPRSPLEAMSQLPRAVSGASTATTSRGLPSRPGIPSPLMTMAAARAQATHTPTPGPSSLARSTLASYSALARSTAQPPSRSALAQSTRAPSRTEPRPPSRASGVVSRASIATGVRVPSRAGVRALSPDDTASSPAIPGGMRSPATTTTRFGARSPGPNTLHSLSASVSASTSVREGTTTPTTATGSGPYARARTPTSALGKGPPPVAARKQLSMSASSAHLPSSPAPLAGMRTATNAAAAGVRTPVRRVSLGPEQARAQARALGAAAAAARKDEQAEAAEGYLDRIASGYSTPGRTPPVTGLGKGRPASVPHFGTPPAEVPRIPSVHLREKRRTLQRG